MRLHRAPPRWFAPLATGRGLALLAVLGLGLGWAPDPAQAYVRTLTTESKQAAHWNHPILPLLVHVGDPPTSLTAEQILRATRAAAGAWSRQAIACTQMEVRVVSDPSADALARSDGTSHLVFRSDEWCKKPKPASGRCYEDGMLAVTSVFMRKSDGLILDADIEVNAIDENVIWADFVSDPDVSGDFDSQDLQGALTHEIGHLLGFDHSCLLPGDKPLTDDQGMPLPRCNTNVELPQESVMIASAPVGRPIQRTLSDDDVRGVCAVYPPLTATVPGDHAGCALAPGRPAAPRTPRGPLPWLLLVPAAAWIRARARRRRSRPATAPR